MWKTMFRKRINLGYVDGEAFGYGQRLKAELHVELRKRDQGPELSIVGEIQSPRQRDLLAVGQIRDTLQKLYAEGKLELTIGKKTFAKLMEIWGEWHLNALNPDCEHQREIKKHMIESGEVDESFFYADNYENIVKIPEFARCPKCGYKYGTKWLYRPLPEEVIEFVKSL